MWLWSYYTWLVQFYESAINVVMELLSTFQRYQPKTKTNTYLMNCMQLDDKPLSDYPKRFINLKAQVTKFQKQLLLQQFRAYA